MGVAAERALSRVSLARLDALESEVERLRSLEVELLAAKDVETQRRLAAEAQAQTITERRNSAPQMVKIQLSSGIVHRVVRGSQDHLDAIAGKHGLKVLGGRYVGLLALQCAR